jgi:methylmalonyl-CoA mutase N-terminal domain/subunit
MKSAWNQIMEVEKLGWNGQSYETGFLKCESKKQLPVDRQKMICADIIVGVNKNPPKRNSNRNIRSG